MMGTPQHLDQNRSRSSNLGKCTRPHDDLGSDFDECPLFDSENPRNKFCGACGCHMRFHEKLNVESGEVALEPKHKVFLSHSGAEKDFVEQLCVDLERCDRYPFFDKRRRSLPIGEDFPQHIFAAIHQCHVGVLILSDDFFTRSKWPMMEFVALVKEAKERKSSFKIIPVFLHTSLSEFRDPLKRKRWLSIWHGWSLESTRVIVEEWEAALNYIVPINSLLYDGKSEVKFHEDIVNAICRIVPPETRFEDSHIQGKSRLCKVIREKMIDVQQKDNFNGITFLGLYGVGGIGKTSICKVLCNDFFMEFGARVCHAELGRMSKEELMREVVKRLTDTNHELLNEMNFDKLLNRLKCGIVKKEIFLALDNMSDTIASQKEAEDYLSQSFVPGSIVIVIARSKDTLLRMKPYLEENNCMEMPELEVGEAQSLFTKLSKFEVCNEINDHLILQCIERCHFQKGNDNHGYQYHPLALDVLGRQLRGLGPEACEALLKRINQEDIFNLLGEKEHPIFSILRISFDSLSPKDQLLFMDIALYLPTMTNWDWHDVKVNVLEWLGMVHGIGSVADVKRRLDILKRRSLLESFTGDGIHVRIGMHDLWREFSVAETEYEEIGCRHWIYHTTKQNEHFETIPSGNWQNVKRMAILDPNFAWGSLERVNFAHFPNVTVLILSEVASEQLVLDLSGLVHLKSLEVKGVNLHSLVLQGLPRKISFLSTTTLGCFILNIDCYAPMVYPTATNLDARSHLHLQTLHLRQLKQWDASYSNSMKAMLDLGKFPTLSNLRLFGCNELSALSSSVPLTSLSELDARNCKSLKVVPNLEMFPALTRLSVGGCGELRELCSSVPLTSLSKLDAENCKSLKVVPDLGMFPALTRLSVSGCGELRELSSNVPLTLLSKLDAENCKSLKVVPDLEMFRALTCLSIDGCDELRELSNSVPLTSLSKLDTRYCEGLKAVPDLGLFPALTYLSVGGCGELRELSSSVPLTSLSKLNAENCKSLKAVPDLGMFPALTRLTIGGCGELRELSSSVPLTLLSKLDIGYCEGLKVMPNLGMFPALTCLLVFGCGALRELSSSIPLTLLSELDTRYCEGLKAVPNLEMFPILTRLLIGGCGELRELSSNVSLTSLSQLDAENCKGLKAMPDLGMFPALTCLLVFGCDELRELKSSIPLTLLSVFNARNCKSLKAVIDLGMFPALTRLLIGGCGELRELSSNVPLTSLFELDTENCKSLKAVPNLGMFPALTRLSVGGCGELRELSSNISLTLLSELNAENCKSLTVMPDLGMFPALTWLSVGGCGELRELSSSVPLTSLCELDTEYCKCLKAVPDLGMFPALTRLSVGGCGELEELSGNVLLTSLSKLDTRYCEGLKIVPDLKMFPALTRLLVFGCGILRELSSSMPLTLLSVLDARNCKSLKAMSDLGMFPALTRVTVGECDELIELSSSVPLTSLSMLDARNCKSLKAVPDLGMFPALTRLSVGGCGELRELSSSVPLTSLFELDAENCMSLRALPDLGMFPALTRLSVGGCCELRALSSSVPLTSLSQLNAENCEGLKEMPDLGMFPALTSHLVFGCGELRE